jgi:hypothetical protein
MNDSLHITQCSSKWQLAHKKQAIYIARMFKNVLNIVKCVCVCVCVCEGFVMCECFGKCILYSD